MGWGWWGGGHLHLCHVVMQPSVVDQLQDDPQALGRLVEFVHAHHVTMPYALHNLDLTARQEAREYGQIHTYIHTYIHTWRVSVCVLARHADIEEKVCSRSVERVWSEGVFIVLPWWTCSVHLRRMWCVFEECVRGVLRGYGQSVCSLCYLGGHALCIVHLGVLPYHLARKGLLRHLVGDQYHLARCPMPQYLPETKRGCVRGGVRRCVREEGLRGHVVRVC